MTGFEACKIFTALNSHFFLPSYDYFHYRGSISLKPETYNSKSSYIKFSFEKLAKKFSQKEDLENFLAANLVSREKKMGYVGEVLHVPADQIYTKWLGLIQSLEYIFLCEIKKLVIAHGNFNGLFTIKNGQHPELLKSLVRGDLSLETFVLLDYILNFFKDWDIRLGDDLTWSTVHQKVKKYAPFVMRINTADADSLKKKLREALQNLGEYSPNDAAKTNSSN